MLGIAALLPIAQIYPQLVPAALETAQKVRGEGEEVREVRGEGEGVEEGREVGGRKRHVLVSVFRRFTAYIMLLEWNA